MCALLHCRNSLHLNILIGGREVEVIGTPERVSEANNQKGKTPPDHRVSCRDLGEADHEGWLAKKGRCGGLVPMKSCDFE